MDGKVEILYIDDEIQNLIGFRASLRYDYTVHTASNTTEAREILASHSDIRVIFCDQRMPAETGVEFLQSIRREFPLPVRILLTAYADMETVIDAINKGHIYKFVRKPWLAEDIISSIEEANKFYVTNSLLDIRNKELQIAYDELDRFAYSVSHDLKDPLSGIKSAINVAQDFNKIEDILAAMSLIEDSLDRLDNYVDRLRDYYLIRRGALSITPIDFHELLESVDRFYTSRPTNKDVKLELQVEQHGEFNCDRVILEMILHNLLSNAFKYQKTECEDKWINIQVRVENKIARILVSDNGIGIDSAYLEDIFKIFFRGTNQAHGMGFGLYNLYHVLLKLQGTIAVESELGTGTTFTIEIPSK